MTKSRRANKTYKPSATLSVFKPQYNIKLGLRIDGKGGKDNPRSIYREYGDYIDRSYTNLRYELLAKDVPFDKVLETVATLREKGL